MIRKPSNTTKFKTAGKSVVYHSASNSTYKKPIKKAPKNPTKTVQNYR